MTKLIIFAVLVLSIALLLFPRYLSMESPDPLETLDDKSEYMVWVNIKATEYGVSASQMKKVIDCESGFNPRAINYNDSGKGKHSIGIAQFQETTFYSFAPKAGIQNPDIQSVKQQVHVMAYMFSIGQARQWTCARLTSQ